MCRVKWFMINCSGSALAPRRTVGAGDDARELIRIAGREGVRDERGDPVGIAGVHLDADLATGAEVVIKVHRPDEERVLEQEVSGGGIWFWARKKIDLATNSVVARHTFHWMTSSKENNHLKSLSLLLLTMTISVENSYKIRKFVGLTGQWVCDEFMHLHIIRNRNNKVRKPPPRI